MDCLTNALKKSKGVAAPTPSTKKSSKSNTRPLAVSQTKKKNSQQKKNHGATIKDTSKKSSNKMTKSTRSNGKSTRSTIWKNQLQKKLNKS